LNELIHQEEENDGLAQGSISTSSKRKTQFRWNARADVGMLHEVDTIRPFLVEGKGSKLKWDEVSLNVNNLLGSNLDYVAISRRFKLLITDFIANENKNRYKWVEQHKCISNSYLNYMGFLLHAFTVEFY